jgi:hypothetical protein
MTGATKRERALFAGTDRPAVPAYASSVDLPRQPTPANDSLATGLEMRTPLLPLAFMQGAGAR